MHPSRIDGHTDDLDHDCYSCVSWTLVWFARCFVAFISRYRYHVLRVRVSGRGFLPLVRRTAEVRSLISFFFRT